jgi:transposase
VSVKKGQLQSWCGRERFAGGWGLRGYSARAWAGHGADDHEALMFFPEQNLRVFLYGQPVDMRRSFDGLYAIARHGMQQDPLLGQLFAFVNRRATQIKVLYWDRNGWCVWAKRLEQGRLISDWNAVVTGEIDCMKLKLLLEGVEVKRVRHRYRMPIKNTV